MDLSATYLDVLKDRLYCSHPDDAGRRAAQTVAYRIARMLATLAAPVLVFTADEVGAPPRRAADRSTRGVRPAGRRRGGSRPRRALHACSGLREEVNKLLEPRCREGGIGKSLEAALVLGGDRAALDADLRPPGPAWSCASSRRRWTARGRAVGGLPGPGARGEGDRHTVPALLAGAGASPATPSTPVLPALPRRGAAPAQDRVMLRSLLIAAAVLAADQLTKAWIVVNYLLAGTSTSSRAVRLVHTRNRGVVRPARLVGAGGADRACWC